MDIVFFGSFQHYSAQILESLITNHQSLITVSAVVTTPPMPVGRKQIITKTPVHLLAEQHSLPVFTPVSLLDPPGGSNLPQPDFFVTAGYGKILPKVWLEYPKRGSLNLHFSLLPAYRGANPAEWAIMCGETTTGISLITMTDKLDGGDILVQSEIPIDPTDTREALYQKLYTLGAQLLPQWLGEVAANAIAKPIKQPKKSPTPYAALLKRNDGFLPWTTIQKFLNHQKIKITDFPSPHLQSALSFLLSKSADNQILRHAAEPRHRGGKSSTAQISVVEDFISSLPRALATYPSLWTIIPTAKGDKRMKILNFSPFTVQIEGQSPATFNQIKNQII